MIKNIVQNNMIEEKNILITGGNSGIGFFAVLNLLKSKNNLYILIKSNFDLELS